MSLLGLPCCKQSTKQSWSYLMGHPHENDIGGRDESFEYFIVLAYQMQKALVPLFG